MVIYLPQIFDLSNLTVESKGFSVGGLISGHGRHNDCSEKRNTQVCKAGT